MAEVTTGQAEEMLRAGQLSQALEQLKQQVRKDPANARDRVFLFQLLSVMGQWERALTQLNVAAEMDPVNLLMAQMCRHALNCEAFRAEVFAGKRAPLIFGEPEEWVGWMVQANQMTAQGHHEQAQELRGRAFEAAPAVSGKINDTPFEWIADADPRLGPVLEAIINGQYYWVPMFRIHQLMIDEPVDLRDLVWVPANFIWTHGGQSVGLIPTRYPGSQDSDDHQIQMARKTDWVDQGDDLFLGLGQRMFTTDRDEYPILETRHITLDNHEEADPPQESGDG